MSERKPDAWMDEQNLQCVHRVQMTRALEARCTVPLYRRTPQDRHTLLDAADFLEDLVMDEDDEADVLAKRLRAMAGDA